MITAQEAYIAMMSAVRAYTKHSPKGRLFRVREHERKPGLSVAEGTSLFWKIRNSGGFTYSPVHRESPKGGFAVSVFRQYETPLKASSVTAEAIRGFVKKNWNVFKRYAGAHIGGWYDSQSKQVFLDISIVEKSKNKAVALGRKHKQLAIFDLGRMREVRLAAAALRFVRFDFPSDATPEEIAEAIRNLDR